MTIEDQVKTYGPVIAKALERYALDHGVDAVKWAISQFQQRRIHKQANEAIDEIHDAAEKKRREAEGDGHE